MKLEGNGLVFKKLKRGTRSSENERNSTTPDKEIRLYSMHPSPSDFFPFLCNFLLDSMILSLDF
jgi:hypothetical protein